MKLLLIAIALLTLAPLAASAGLPPAEKCETVRLKGGTQLCEAVFGCAAKGAKKELPVIAESCSVRARSKWAASFGKGSEVATRGGGACDLSGDPTRLADEFEAMLAETLDAVMGLDEKVPGSLAGDPKLLAEILKAADAFCSKAFTLEGKNVKKPNPVLFESKLADARLKFRVRSDKAIGKALQRGVIYSGLPIPDVADAIQLATENESAYLTCPAYLDSYGDPYFDSYGDSYRANCRIVTTALFGPQTPALPLLASGVFAACLLVRRRRP